jgi:formamidopyrimidine-DNA glycosylase
LKTVARIVHFLRLHVVGKRIISTTAIDDKNVFGKVGTSGEEVEAALKGNKVSESFLFMAFEILMNSKIMSAGSQGKYFW